MSRRRRRRGYSKRRLKQRRKQGWNMNLYRNTNDGKIAGVCAGIADHFDIAHWVMRLTFVGAFLFTGTLAFWVYVAAWCLMAPRRDDVEVEEAVEYDERRREYRPRSMFRYSENASTRIKTAQARVQDSLDRIKDMESYVTSRQYQLNKEFSKLAD